MDAIRRTCSTVKRCKKAVWKSIKKNNPLSCFRRRRTSKTKCTMENVPDVVTIIAADNKMLHETLTVTKTVGELEQTSAAQNSSKTEERKEPEINDTKGKPQNAEIEEITKMKRKLRDNMKSQNAISKQTIKDEGDDTQSFDPFPIGSKEETASAETVTNILPSVMNIETECPEIREFDNGNIGDGDLYTQPMTSAETRSDISWRTERVNNNAAERTIIRKSSNCYNGAENQRSQTKTVIKISSTGEGKTKRKVVHMYLSSNKNVVLNKAENAWIPASAARRAAMNADGVVAVTNTESNAIEEINKSVRSILNKLTTENLDELIKSFMALPLNTIEHLENAVDLVFEKAIQEQSYAPLYAIVCSAMQSVQVTCAENKKTMSFKSLINKKCQRFFEADKTKQTDSAKKLEEIRSCKNLEKKEEFQLGYSENERRLRERFFGNCCFIGELFNQHVVHPINMQFCIAYLICQQSEEPIKCLCNLLRISGKELERWCNLDETFDILKVLMSGKSMSSRHRFMIQDIVELRKNKWLPRPGTGKQLEFGRLK